jgi:hypothetical protein
LYRYAQYTANRINKILSRKAAGEHPYPHKFHVRFNTRVVYHS